MNTIQKIWSIIHCNKSPTDCENIKNELDLLYRVSPALKAMLDQLAVTIDENQTFFDRIFNPITEFLYSKETHFIDLDLFLRRLVGFSQKGPPNLKVIITQDHYEFSKDEGSKQSNFLPQYDDCGRHFKTANSIVINSKSTENGEDLGTTSCMIYYFSQFLQRTHDQNLGLTQYSYDQRTQISIQRIASQNP